MIDFSIDISDVVSELSLTQQDADEAVAYCVKEVTAEVYRAWTAEAKDNLGSTRSQYIAALGMEKIDNHTSVIFLDPEAWLPNAIEQGVSSFDMKPGFLSSSKVKYTKDGSPFLTIPFRFATPGSIGESTAFAGVMPQSIYDKVRQQVPNSREQLKLSDIPSEFHIPKSISLRNTLKSIGYDSLSKKEPRTSIYEGLQRTTGGYINFRRVSLRSDADRWVHPGFQAKDLARLAEQKVQSRIPDIVDNALDNFLANLGF